jgi:hypothetical protein
MCNTTHNHEDEHFPCFCHRAEYAYTDSLCPFCEEEQAREREARREEEIEALEEWGYEAEETTRPACCVCAGSDTLCGVCEEILDRANMAEADAQADATEDPGYEADEEHLLYWDQHAEG